MANTLQQLLNSLSGLDVTPILRMLVQRQLIAGEIYIKERERSKKLAFIEKGIMRAYAVKENGDDATLYIRWEGQLIASHEGIIDNQASHFTYKALEDVSLLEIDYEQLEQFMEQHREYETLRIFFLKNMLSEALGKMETFVLYSPEERYLKLIAGNLDIVNRVPDKYIASMLGVTPVSLSRIRKRLQGRK